MKKVSAVVSLAFSARPSNLPWALSIVIPLAVITGLLMTNTIDEMFAYLLVTLACGVPAVLWIMAGAPGIPILPTVSVMCFIYYALPILRKETTLAEYAPSEILNVAITVAL